MALYERLGFTTVGVYRELGTARRRMGGRGDHGEAAVMYEQTRGWALRAVEAAT